jgi:hypothetical protein
MKYYWVTVDFELMGNDYSDRFLLKHDTTISKEDALERYVLECVDEDAIFETDIPLFWSTDKGNIRDYSFTEVPLEDALIMEKYTNSLTFDGVKDEV